MALDEVKKPVTAGEISEFIALRSKERIYKASATIKDSLDNRLNREDLVVEDHSMKKKSRMRKESAQTCFIPSKRNVFDRYNNKIANVDKTIIS